MYPKLILLSGAPGVGKTEVASRLVTRLGDCAWLDGDDVWRIHPFRVDRESVRVAERNIVSVLGNFLSAGFPHVVLSWVLHRRAIVDRIIEGIDGPEFAAGLFTLTCDEATLLERWRETHAGEVASDLPLKRLEETRVLDSVQIDTTGLDPSGVADVLHAMIVGDKVAWQIRRDGGAF